MLRADLPSPVAQPRRDTVVGAHFGCAGQGPEMDLQRVRAARVFTSPKRASPPIYSFHWGVPCVDNLASCVSPFSPVTYLPSSPCTPRPSTKDSMSNT